MIIIVIHIIRCLVKGDKIMKLNLHNHVLLLGAVHNVCDYLQAMDVFIFPSLYEGFGNVAIKAQAAGLKVIASNRVPNSIKITELVEFISLESPIDKWVQAVLSSNNFYSRRNTYEDIVASGYDISERAKFLEQYYINLAK